MKNESKAYDRDTGMLDVDALFARERPAKPAAAVTDVEAARRRLRKEPVTTWENSVAKFTKRTDAAAANVRDLQTAFDAASRAVARDKAGAEERQSELHNQLVSARGEHEKASAALAVAVKQLEESKTAEFIVLQADNAKKKTEAHEAAKAKAREAVERHDKALAELREADKGLRETVCAAVAFEPYSEFSARFDIVHVLRVCYTGDGVLPVVWPKGFYDLARAGFATDPNSTSPRAAIPSVGYALSNHIS